MTKRIPGSLKLHDRIFLILLPAAVSFIALCVGRYPLPVTDVARAIAEKLGANVTAGAQTAQILWSMRLPRVLLALLVGAGLSASGCAFQSLFANPLATPDTLGVASGASFGAAAALLFGLGLAGVQVSALVFGLAAVALTYLSGRGRGGTNTIVLAGIMIGSLFTALVSLVKFAADTESQLPAITYWLMGSLGGKSYDTLALGAPLILAGLIVL
ncbi:MAG: iron chelate uptake ABC transporter family permease subunit, partial [Eubacteriales bacterium]|nr:iron chelate uptake ABC transporter family permease subunit [Eubacteriales bacterium]